MAQRYTQKKKDAVVSFVQQYNEENGRGGQSAGVKKFGINPITIRSWMEKAGVAAPGKSAKKKGPKAKGLQVSGKKSTAGRKKAVVATVATGGDVSASLLRMAAIQSEIQALQSEYASLKEQI